MTKVNVWPEAQKKQHQSTSASLIIWIFLVYCYCIRNNKRCTTLVQLSTFFGMNSILLLTLCFGKVQTIYCVRGSLKENKNFHWERKQWSKQKLDIQLCDSFNKSAPLLRQFIGHNFKSWLETVTSVEST